MSGETVSKRTFEKATDRNKALLKRIANEKKSKAEGTQVLIRAVGVAGSAGAIGYLEGKSDLDEKGEPVGTQVFGLPLGLIVAAGGTLLNIGGYAGDDQTSALVQAVADGGFAAYSYDKGKKMGLESKKPTTT